MHCIHTNANATVTFRSILCLFCQLFVSSKQVIVNICKQMQRKAGNRTITDGLIETSVKQCTAQATYKHIKQEERVGTG